MGLRIRKNLSELTSRQKNFNNVVFEIDFSESKNVKLFEREGLTKTTVIEPFSKKCVAKLELRK